MDLPHPVKSSFTVKIHARPAGGSGEAASYFRVPPDHGFGLSVSTACRQTGGRELRCICELGSKRGSFSEAYRSKRRLCDDSASPAPPAVFVPTSPRDRFSYSGVRATRRRHERLVPESSNRRRRVRYSTGRERRKTAPAMRMIEAPDVRSKA
jgi:hypothetical protein